MIGRKRIYRVEVLVLAAGAIGCALSPNIWWLIGLRFILGVGIGGDYPVSATIMSEYAGKKTRGMLVTLVFTMQAAGLILGPLLASALLASHLSQQLMWRILLAFGAVPALTVYMQRRGLKETPRYLAAAGKKEDGDSGKLVDAGDSQKSDESPKVMDGFKKLHQDRQLLAFLIGSSAAWFLMDAAYYGNTVSSPLVLSALGQNNSVSKYSDLRAGIFKVLGSFDPMMVREAARTSFRSWSPTSCTKTPSRSAIRLNSVRFWRV
jgi:PHS family inorganic phosphate transporter-like MFS transporter